MTSIFFSNFRPGHVFPNPTQHYVDITQTKLAGTLSKAGDFERNRRRVSVLIDQDAISSGQGEDILSVKILVNIDIRFLLRLLAMIHLARHSDLTDI